MFSERSADGSPSLRSVMNLRSPARSTVAFGPVFSCETVLITAILFPTLAAWSRPIVQEGKPCTRAARKTGYLARRKRAPVKPISLMNAPVEGGGTRRSRASALLVVSRPRQWLKNGLVAAALVFSHRLFIARDAALTALGFVAFCTLSSLAYVLNDISDRDADRLNPEKRDRPLARGDLSVSEAASFAVALALVSFILSLVLSRFFLAIAVLYIAL